MLEQSNVCTERHINISHVLSTVALDNLLHPSLSLEVWDLQNVVPILSIGARY